MSDDCTSTGEYGGVCCGAEGCACPAVLSSIIFSSDGYFITGAFYPVDIFSCEGFDNCGCECRPSEIERKSMKKSSKSKSSKSKPRNSKESKNSKNSKKPKKSTKDE